MRAKVLAIAASVVLAAVTAGASVALSPDTQSDGGLPGPHDERAAAEAGRQAGAEQPNTMTRQALSTGTTQATQSFLRYRVFATQYNPNTAGSLEVAVPDKCVKFAALGNTGALSNAHCSAGYTVGADYRVVVQRDNGRSATIPVKDVGPWNVDDNYWDPVGGPRPRRLFRDLPQGKPEAQAAFYDGYNTVSNCTNLDGSPSGRTAGADQFGRCVLNPPGIDLSVSAASQLGLGSGQNEWVTVTYLWEPGAPTSKPGVVRGNVWYLRSSLTTGNADITVPYGNAGDDPLMCDWNGDGVKTPAVHRGNVFYIKNSFTTGNADITVPYGNNGDLPVCGDWNGDGIETPGVVRGNVWYLKNSLSTGNADVTVPYANAGDIPLPGDWNGDGVDTPGVRRGKTWYLKNSLSTGNADITFDYGFASDLPIVGDWDGNRSDTAGVIRGNVWYLKNSHTSGAADFQFPYANTGDIPVVWR